MITLGLSVEGGSCALCTRSHIFLCCTPADGSFILAVSTCYVMLWMFLLLAYSLKKPTSVAISDINLYHFPGGAYKEDALENNVTHLIVGRPSRNEKCLTALACGIWVLDSKYLDACEQAQKFLQACYTLLSCMKLYSFIILIYIHVIRKMSLSLGIPRTWKQKLLDLPVSLMNSRCLVIVGGVFCKREEKSWVSALVLSISGK